ncbi:hypothetical protein ACIQM4_18445 [Streptomyces sp. NPDC091272]|uniref:hypothetical protein n=1 Tax=Streptomyces sp. NPDC091272 TaxID=3365981 RepID=UPI00380F1DAF
MANRYWCSECTFRTPWLAGPEGRRRQIEHYARKHPGTQPGGQVETRRRCAGGDRGRRHLCAVVVLALLVTAVALALVIMATGHRR